MRKLLQVVLVAVAIAVATPLRAQTVDPTFTPVSTLQSGQVYTAVPQADGKYLVGGRFMQVNGSAVTGLARLNADGSLDQAFTSTAACQSNVARVRVLSNGQLLVQGDTLQLGGRRFFSLAKLNANGSVAADFASGAGAAGTDGQRPITGVVVQADGKILVSGPFETYNGVVSNGLVRLNANGSVDQAFSTALGAGFVYTSGGAAYVQSVVVQPDGKILVGGNFENYNNTGRKSLVRLNANGTLDSSFVPFANSNVDVNDVLGLALDPRTNYVLVYSNSTGPELARLTTTGQIDYTFSFAGSLDCLSYAYENSERFVVDAAGRVLVGNCFVNYAGAPGNSYVLRFLANGQLDTQLTIGQQLDDEVYSIKLLTNGEILLGGRFGRYGTLRNANLVRVSATGQALATPRATLMQPGNTQDIVQQPDGKLLVAGRFWQINGQAAGNVARLNANGTLDPTFQLTGFDAQIQQLALRPDGRIMALGDFTSVGTHASPLVARLLADGSPDVSFMAPVLTGNYSFSRSLSALALQTDGSVVVGNSSNLFMGGYGGVLHRLLPSGAVDAAYAGRVASFSTIGGVYSLAIGPGNKLYAGGLQYNGPALVRLNADGSPDNSFAPVTSAGSMHVVKLLPLPSGQLLVAGGFQEINGVPRTNLARINANGTLDTGFVPPQLTTGSLFTLAAYANGRVLIGGGSQIVNGINRGLLARLNPDGSYDSSFAPSLQKVYVSALTLQANEAILVGGYALQLGGQSLAPLVRLTAPNVLTISKQQSTARTEAWPVPAHETLHVSLEAAAHPSQLTLFDALGKPVQQQFVTSAELTLPVQHLPAGVYLLRVQYADGPVTRRVVVE